MGYDLADVSSHLSTPAPSPLGRADLAIAALLAALAAAVILPGLGAAALASWDEASYGVIARGLLARPSATLHYGAEPYLEKPPVLFWLMAGSARALGESELSLRLPTAVLGIATVLLTWLAGRRLAGRAAGVLAALLLLGAPQFAAWSRLAMTDIPLVAFGMLAVVLVLYGEDRPRLTIGAGVALGLAVMTKSVAALLFVPGLAALIAARRGARALVARDTLAGALALVLVAAPWHVYMVATWGHAFLRDYLLVNVIERVEHPLENHAGTRAFYLALYRHNAGLLAGPHAAGVLAALALFLRRRDRDLGALAAFAITAFAGVNAMGTKIGWYLLPVYPAAALATAVAARRLAPGAMAGAAACVLAGLLAFPGAIYGRGAFVQEYNIVDRSDEVRALAAARGATGRLAEVNTVWVSEPAVRYYLADRVDEIDPDAAHARAARPGPFACVLFHRQAADLVARHPDLRITAETPSLALVER